MCTLRKLSVVLPGCVLLLGLSSCSTEPSAKVTHYEPNWESIGQHQVPEWYEDAKLGIFIHWGLYSVPAWATPIGELGKVDWNVWFKNNPYAEWYLNTLKIEGSPTQKHHKETYGDNFDYIDFIPEFNESIKKWKPEEWAQLFGEVGARYVVLTTKHHDGFTLWPSQVKNPNRKDDQQGAERDLVGELSKAVRGQGMKMGLYYSGGLDWSFYEPPITGRDDVRGTVVQTPEFTAYVDAHWRELIEKYQPAILWNDISYPKAGDTLGIFSDYYNEFPDGVINNRWGVEFNDFTTPEYRTYDTAQEEKWESCRGLGYSFGYNRAEGPEHMLSIDELVDFFIDIVSKNGNLLLNIGPKADGSLQDLQVERLRGLGKWLKTNGDAIFGTRPWTHAEGKTSDGIDVRFTKKGEALYAILLEAPKGGTVNLEALSVQENSTVQLLGASENLKWSQEGDNLSVTLPDELPGAPAYALKITPQPKSLATVSKAGI